MPKNYQDRQMAQPEEGPLEVFFYPKHVPPVSIKARTQVEADKKLAELDNKKEK